MLEILTRSFEPGRYLIRPARHTDPGTAWTLIRHAGNTRDALECVDAHARFHKLSHYRIEVER